MRKIYFIKWDIPDSNGDITKKNGARLVLHTLWLYVATRQEYIDCKVEFDDVGAYLFVDEDVATEIEQHYAAECNKHYNR